MSLTLFFSDDVLRPDRLRARFDSIFAALALIAGMALVRYQRNLVEVMAARAEVTISSMNRACIIGSRMALAAAMFFALAPLAKAHGIGGKDAAFVAASAGPQIIPFLYLGAKHMVTGYDHLLFLFGIVFFLYRLKHVALYVTMFSLGHSATLLAGVLGNIQVNSYLVDALIGLSVVYKAFDNLGGFPTVFGVQPNAKLAVLGFGLVHGFGLATKLQDLGLSKHGLLTNMISFNVGVELGQLLALTVILGLMRWWRTRAGFARQAVFANVLIVAAGFLLMEYQLAGYFTHLKA